MSVPRHSQCAHTFDAVLTLPPFPPSPSLPLARFLSPVSFRQADSGPSGIKSDARVQPRRGRSARHLGRHLGSILVIRVCVALALSELNSIHQHFTKSALSTRSSPTSRSPQSQVRRTVHVVSEIVRKHSAQQAAMLASGKHPSSALSHGGSSSPSSQPRVLPHTGISLRPKPMCSYA